MQTQKQVKQDQLHGKIVRVEANLPGASDRNDINCLRSLFCKMVTLTYIVKVS